MTRVLYEPLAVTSLDPVASSFVILILNDALALVKLVVIVVKLEAVTSRLVVRTENEPDTVIKLEEVASNNTTRGTKFEAVASVLVTRVEKLLDAVVNLDPVASSFVIRAEYEDENVLNELV